MAQIVRQTGPGIGVIRRGPPSAALEVLGVDVAEALPLVGQLVLGEARVDRARLDARVAVDALLRVDVELLDLVVVRLVGRGVDAVDRADLDARVVLRADARLGDDVGHGVGFLAGRVVGPGGGTLPAGRCVYPSCAVSSRGACGRPTGRLPRAGRRGPGAGLRPSAG